MVKLFLGDFINGEKFANIFNHLNFINYYRIVSLTWITVYYDFILKRKLFSIREKKRNNIEQSIIYH